MNSQNGLVKGLYASLFDRPKAFSLILILITLISVVATLQIKKQLVPAYFGSSSFHIRFSNVYGSPQDIDQSYARPISEEIQKLAGIRRVNTYSDLNRFRIRVNFFRNVDPKEAGSRLQSALASVRKILPDDASYRIRRWNPDKMPIYWLGIVTDPSANKIKEQTYFEDYIKPQIERLDGVAQIETYGKSNEKLGIEIRDNSTKQLNISIANVHQKLGSYEIQSSIGTIAGFSVFIDRVFTTISDIKNILLTENIKLHDVATVIKDGRPRQRYVSLDGKAMFFASISKTDDANLLEVSDAIQRKFDELEESSGGRIKFQILFSQAKDIRAILIEVVKSIAYATLFAFFIVLIFTRRLRFSTEAMIAMPSSILLTIAALHYYGESLNLLTLSGILLSTGLLIDNAIVIVEQIHRKGYKSITGLFAPLIIATATTICIFLPGFLFSNEGSFINYLQNISIPIAFSLTFSLFIALFVIPFFDYLSSHIAKHYSKNRTKEKKPMQPNRILRPVLTFLKGCLKNPIEAYSGILFVLVAAILALFLVENHYNGFKPKRYWFYLEFPNHMEFTQKKQLTKTIEQKLLDNRENLQLKHLRANLWGPNSKRTSFQINLDPNSTISSAALDEKLKAILPKIVGAKFSLEENVEDEILETVKLNWSITGYDLSQLRETLFQLRDSVKRIYGVKSVAIGDEEENSLDFIVKPIRSKTTDPQFSPLAISKELRASLKEQQLGKLDDFLPIRAKSNTKEKSRSTILERKIGYTPISAITYSSLQEANSSIRRKNGRVVLDFEVKLDPKLEDEVLSKTKTTVSEFVSSMNFPPGILLENESLRAAKKNRTSFPLILGLGVLLIFTIVCSYFESIVIGFVIACCIIFSAIGCMISGKLFGSSGGFADIMATLLLAGLIVNIGIVLIAEFQRQISTLDKQTTKLEDFYNALVESCRIRISPISMTVLTTIAGLIPMAVSQDPMQGLPFSDLAKSVIIGLLFAAPLSVIWITVSFSQLKKRQLMP